MRKISFALAIMALCTFFTTAEDYSLGIDAPYTQQNEIRQRQCLNGLWRFFPIPSDQAINDAAPESGSGWGYFKVPGVWPESKSPTSPFLPLLNDKNFSNPSKWHTAWYSRWIETPESSEGKEVFLDIGIIQTRGMVYVDGQKAGEIIFPGGQLNITKYIKPGSRQKLDIRVSAVPLSAGDHYIVMDGNNVSAVAAKVKNRGITSDVYLDIVPPCRIERTHYITSFRNHQITFASETSGLAEGKTYTFEAKIKGPDGNIVKNFMSTPFTKDQCPQGKLALTFDWKDPLLWDTDTPQNIYTASLTLKQEEETVDQTIDEKFGFREYWIDGQNYVLNGKPIHLRAYHLENYSASWSPDRASKEWAKEAYRRLKELGFNFTISRNYNFTEGAVNYLEGSFEAADETGHLHSMSLPHPWQFNPLSDEENAKKFAAMSEYLIKRCWNHPSLVMYVTNHNYAGAWGDQNPLRVGGEYQRANNPEEVKYKEEGRNNFLIAQKIIANVDATRPTYSHASGSLGGQYSLNMYLDWAPIQERSDWLEHFYAHGKYPLSLVEWGLPHNASFSSYRGPKFIWGTEDVMTFWDAEYCALLYGDTVAEWTPQRLKLLNRLVSLGNKKIKWGKLNSIGSKLPDVIRLQGDFFSDNLRSLRAWNVALILPWDSYAFFKENSGHYPSVENKKRLKNLNKPGIAPDFSSWGNYVLTPHKDQFGLSYLGEVIRKWNQPVIAWIGGQNEFTSKEHIYTPGSTVKKTLVIVNDEREALDCDYTFWLRGHNLKPVYGKTSVEAGRRITIPTELQLPENLQEGEYEIAAEFKFSNGNKLVDSLKINVIPTAKVKPTQHSIALFDPEEKTSLLLDKLGLKYTRIDSDTNLLQYQLLIVGRNALYDPNNHPDFNAVKSGLNVLILEQNTQTLKRLGFRYQEYGLRRLFLRSSGHPVFAGMPQSLFHDWKGKSTLTPEYLDYNQYFCPKWDWCGFENTRVWRANNRGNVSSVQIEKPAIGNFNPLLDGGFALQYSPLIEYTEGKGRIILSQLDIVTRTSGDPASEMILANCINYLLNTKSPVYTKVAAIGGEDFISYLSSLHIDNMVENITEAETIIIGPGADNYPDMSQQLEIGKKLILMGLSESTAKLLLPNENFSTNKNHPSQMADLSEQPLKSISNLDTAFQTRLTYTTHDGKELSAKQITKGLLVFSGVLPTMLDYDNLFRLRSSFRRRAFLTSQLLRNAGISLESDFIERLNGKTEDQPWLHSYYIQAPIAGDDPYRYYHW